jgi:hypothetical protein
MGYYTAYKLQAVYPREMYQCILEELEIESGSEGCLRGEDTIKWYSWQSDCQKVSERYPTTAFRLSGLGEDQGDVWWEEYLGGVRVSTWRLTLPDIGELSEETLALAIEKEN